MRGWTVRKCEKVRESQGGKGGRSESERKCEKVIVRQVGLGGRSESVWECKKVRESLGE